MKWVTRERVNVDRVACLWLIRKNGGPQTAFLFLSSNADCRQQTMCIYMFYFPNLKD